MLIRILTNTPLWVWAVLALTIALGLRARRPGEASPWRLALLPLVAAALSLWRLAVAPEPALPALGWAAGLAFGALAGAAAAAPVQARTGQGGRLQVPGTWVWLAFGVGIFAAAYALNVAFALDRSWAGTPAGRMAPLALAGFATGFSAGWLAGLLRSARRTAAA